MIFDPEHFICYYSYFWKKNNLSKWNNWPKIVKNCSFLDYVPVDAEHDPVHHEHPVDAEHAPVHPDTVNAEHAPEQEGIPAVQVHEETIDNAE